MKKDLKRLAFSLVILFAVNSAYSVELFHYWSKAGEAGTWTYGSCYGNGGNCQVTWRCNENGCSVGHTIYYL